MSKFVELTTNGDTYVFRKSYIKAIIPQENLIGQLTYTCTILIITKKEDLTAVAPCNVIKDFINSFVK